MKGGAAMHQWQQVATPPLRAERALLSGPGRGAALGGVLSFGLAMWRRKGAPGDQRGGDLLYRGDVQCLLWHKTMRRSAAVMC